MSSLGTGARTGHRPRHRLHSPGPDILTSLPRRTTSRPQRLTRDIRRPYRTAARAARRLLNRLRFLNSSRRVRRPLPGPFYLTNFSNSAARNGGSGARRVSRPARCSFSRAVSRTVLSRAVISRATRHRALDRAVVRCEGVFPRTADGAPLGDGPAQRRPRRVTRPGLGLRGLVDWCAVRARCVRRLRRPSGLRVHPPILTVPRRLQRPPHHVRGALLQRGALRLRRVIGRLLRCVPRRGSMRLGPFFRRGLRRLLCPVPQRLRPFPRRRLVRPLLVLRQRHHLTHPTNLFGATIHPHTHTPPHTPHHSDLRNDTRSDRSRSDSSVNDDSPEPRIASANARLDSSISAMRSSTVPSVMRRWTWTGWVWPMR